MSKAENINRTLIKPVSHRSLGDDPNSGEPRDDCNIGSIFILRTEPMAGIWFPKTSKGGFDLRYSWEVRDKGINWQPRVPVNSCYWEERIEGLVAAANDRRQSGAFLRLSKTSATHNNWSLPAIGACPVRDESCQECYALSGWYRLDHPRQLDRVLRLEYLQRLIRENKLEVWQDWMVNKLNAVVSEEPFPRALGANALPQSFNDGGAMRYMRWHDSGDLFEATYALAIFEVCEATPSVAHFLPTRLGALIKSLVQKGARIPKNLSIQVSVHYGGKLASVQLQAVHDVLKIQPSARIGLSYVVSGPALRKVDLRAAQQTFGLNAVVCPIITAKAPKDRVCAGCRRCWAADLNAPVIYPKY